MYKIQKYFDTADYNEVIIGKNNYLDMNNIN